MFRRQTFPMRRALAASMGFALFAPKSADACATCGVGDPTLTSLGAERPTRNRVRASAEFRHRTDSLGERGVDSIAITENRIDTNVAWAPSERVFLQLSVPTMFRSVVYANLAETQIAALGDMEIRSRVYVLPGRTFRSDHVLALIGGLRIPTALAQQTRDGALLPLEAQPGTGSFDPLLGVSYSYFNRTFSLFASLTGYLPTSSRFQPDTRANASLRSTLLAQWQAVRSIALRVGGDVRIDGKATEFGESVRDSGGSVLYATTEVLFSPRTDWTAFASVRIPVAQALSGFHREGTVLGGGVAFDF